MKYLLILLFLVACSANGQKFEEIRFSEDGSPFVVIYRPFAFSGMAVPWEVSIDGKEQCMLHNESYYVYKGSGLLKISAQFFLAPGTSRIDVNAVRGAYYIRMSVDGAKSVSGVIGGMGGYLVAEGMSSTGGPFIFSLIDELQAKQELSVLKRDCI